MYVWASFVSSENGAICYIYVNMEFMNFVICVSSVLKNLLKCVCSLVFTMCASIFF